MQTGTVRIRSVVYKWLIYALQGVAKVWTLFKKLNMQEHFLFTVIGILTNNIFNMTFFATVEKPSGTLLG